MKYKESRRDDFTELFKRLDLSKFSSSFLADTVSTETLVIENHLCTNLVVKALTIKLQKSIFNNPFKILCIGQSNVLAVEYLSFIITTSGGS